MKKFMGLCALAILLSACSTHLADITVISNKNVSLDKINLDKAEQVKNVTGVDSKPIVLFFPLGVPNLKEALNDALRKADGDLMIDASIYRKGWWFLFGEDSIEIKGTVIKTRGDKK